jgi:HEPN domain-containing protein
MIDIAQQVHFWRDGAQEDLTVVQELLERGRIRHGLFFMHLALEKLLKAHVCRQTHDLAPRLHNLVRLANWPSCIYPNGPWTSWPR